MDFDAPLFKVLSKNDSGESGGNQSGILIPTSFVEYFPHLEVGATAELPARDASLVVDVFVDGVPKGTLNTRYQYQTRAANRTPEYRITGNLSDLLRPTGPGDIAVFERCIDDFSRFRIGIYLQGSDVHSAILRQVGNQRFGFLGQVPVKNSEITEAEKQIAKLAESEFKLFAEEVKKVEKNTTRIARLKAFQKAISKNFEHRCAVTGRQMLSPSGSSGTDAAHIVPLSKRGSDDVRNGLSLSKELHWAFDAGLIAILDGSLVVSNFVKQDVRNEYLRSFDGKPILWPSPELLQPSPEALRWHFDNIFLV